MADQKISGLPPDSSIDGNHYTVLNDPTGPTTKRMTLATLIAWLFTQENIPAGNGSPITRLVDTMDNFVLTGLGWTADSFGVTRNGSMSAGTVYINGKKLTLSAVVARAFTASKDTYIDVIDNLNGTASLVYTEVANNATSGMTLAANSKRLCRVVTSGTAITMINDVGYDPLGNRYFNTVSIPPIGVSPITVGLAWSWANGTDVVAKIPFQRPRDLMTVGGKQRVRIQPYLRPSAAGNYSFYRQIYIMRQQSAYANLEPTSSTTVGQTPNYNTFTIGADVADDQYWFDVDLTSYPNPCFIRPDIHRDGAGVSDTGVGTVEMEGILLFYNRDYTKSV